MPLSIDAMRKGSMVSIRFTQAKQARQAMKKAGKIEDISLAVIGDTLHLSFPTVKRADKFMDALPNKLKLK
jgi:hypothetical protein